MDGFRLQATFDGNGFCPIASLFALEGAGAITISGIDQQGKTLTLELDSLNVGTHAMNEATNTLLYTTQLAVAYLTNDATPGTLTITSHDMAARRIKGSFSASLTSELSPTPKSISGSFDVVYVDQKPSQTNFWRRAGGIFRAAKERNGRIAGRSVWVEQQRCQ